VFPQALVGPADAEDDGDMAEHHHDQDDVAEPVRPPLSAAQAREMTAGPREAMDDVRRSVAVLAARVRDAYAARVWASPGHPSWEAYCDAKFGISRAQAYRLLDVAPSQAAIHDAVIAGIDPSRTRDSDPAAAAALDYGLSQRALIAVSGRTGDVAELMTRPTSSPCCASRSASPSSTASPPAATHCLETAAPCTAPSCRPPLPAAPMWHTARFPRWAGRGVRL
jgi:hypothetical protein